MKLLIVLRLPVDVLETLIHLIVQLIKHIIRLTLRVLFVTLAGLGACTILTICHVLY